MDSSEPREDPAVQAPADENLEKTVMTSEDWEKMWNIRDIHFHKGCNHPFLEKYLDKLLAGRENVKIFFPLCGKTVEMKWLADKGHKVVGVDCVEMALQEFMADNSLEFSVEKIDSLPGCVYKTLDGRIHLYCCDMFNFSKEVEGQFGAMWDRGGLVAINVFDRERYVSIMKGMMSADCQYLLSSVDYDSSYTGIPHCVNEETVSALYGNSCHVEKVESIEITTDRFRSKGVSQIFECLYHITPKMDK